MFHTCAMFHTQTRRIPSHLSCQEGGAMRRPSVLALCAALLSVVLSATAANAATVFVPLNPCRAVDTREAGGALAALEERDFLISGATTDYSGQGGEATGCGLPAGA